MDFQCNRLKVPKDASLARENEIKYYGSCMTWPLLGALTNTLFHQIHITIHFSVAHTDRFNAFIIISCRITRTYTGFLFYYLVVCSRGPHSQRQ